ncbi:glycosyl transferase family 1 [Knoellia sinensis KCTC 19936]|uniref:Glycosyl transferase family 1 n=1 Tax=Knoellia sinensis KCTC 19936 TaxID=1385520 RepID=A0A0A0J8N7_9MICO|nr:glycosyltransferase [Knoellia sinensis]KGN32412.1 glycosyl transferase family 1 [Knoellia sinensis KCTC 19936]
MRILMLVATSLATDTRVKREAAALVDAGHTVHVVGRSVPEDFVAGPGITTSSVGTSSVFRKEGGTSLQGRRLPWHLRLARWVLLPQHSKSSFTRWASGAYEDARGREFDVVHAHDFTALEAGERLAREHDVPLVYDTHEYWPGRTRSHRPTPVQRWREARVEKRLGDRAAAVITVGDGVADALRRDYSWPHITVVRNSFPLPTSPDPELTSPTGALYAGRLAPFRDLETVALASRTSSVPIELRGPADESWLDTFEPEQLTVSPPESVDEVTERLRRLGISLVTMAPGWENNVLAMPNKIFHAVHAGVPMVVSDVGEIARLTRELGLGRTYAPGDAQSLVAALNEVAADYPAVRAKVIAARDELSWPRDAAALTEVYQRLQSRPSGSSTLGEPGSTDPSGSEDDE